MKRILVTGTDGFVGGVLQRALRAQGHRVFGTVFTRAAGEDEVRLDITRDGALESLPPERFDAVVHTVGMVDQGAPAALMHAVNAEGTRRLLEWCHRHGCGHFVQISSIGVYGLRSMGQQRREATTASVGLIGVPYQKSKALAERHVVASGLPHTILRLPAVIGAGDTFFSPTLVQALREGRHFSFGRRNPLVSVLYVENLPDMLARVIADGPSGQAFNAACHHVPWRELLAAYAAELGIELEPRRLGLGQLLRGLRDKRFMLLFTCAAFGAHFPNDRFRTAHGLQLARSWREGVAAAVAGLAATGAGQSAPGRTAPP